MKKIGFLVLLFSSTATLFAQENTEEIKGFNKEYLFTGGNVSVGFGSNSFLIGISPTFGYSLTKWADVGVVANYTYSTTRDVSTYNDKLRQSMYGGGAFTKIYPLHFLYLQAQYEHNFIKQKYIVGGTTAEVINFQANSFLIGGGYTSGREGRGDSPFFYLSILLDISGNERSPYNDSFGRTRINVRGGIQVPLFQGRNRGKN